MLAFLPVYIRPRSSVAASFFAALERTHAEIEIQLRRDEARRPPRLARERRRQRVGRRRRAGVLLPAGALSDADLFDQPDRLPARRAGEHLPRNPPTGPARSDARGP